MNYYIADTHLGHYNIIRFCNRPFSDVQNMNDLIISNWNKTVKENDDIYIVGDMFFKMNPEGVIDILSKLKGKKHLIIGNHDNSWISDDIIKKYFVSLDRYLEIHDNNKFVVLSHYPMLSYNKQSGGYMIHGHIHNDTLFDYWPVLIKRDRILNSGVDINNFKPVTIDELIENNKKYKEDKLNSYPCYLLSVRFNIGYIYSKGTNREELYKIINPIFAKYGIIERYEGLYDIKDIKIAKPFIDKFKNRMSKGGKIAKLIKDFDLIFIDENGKLFKL